MELNYRRGQLREIKTEQLIKLDNTVSSKSEQGNQAKDNKGFNFQNSLSEDMARMLQHAY
jgi:hypothetical protein